MLKKLLEEIGAAPATATAPAAPAPAHPRLRPQSRPAARAIIRSTRPSFRARRLNRGLGEGRLGTSSSTSSQSGLDYAVGDSFGIFPMNDPGLVDQIIARA